MSKVIAFTAPFAVYKATVQKGRKTACLWAGYLADRATRKVVWDDGTNTEYGPTTTEDPAFYSDASLAVDMAEGRLVYEAVERLRPKLNRWRLRQLQASCIPPSLKL